MLLSFNPGLVQGQVLSNDSMRKLFECGIMGGMRRSRSTNTLVIITDHTKGFYEDFWHGDVLHYTGMGKIGDQDLYFAQNPTLRDSGTNGVDVHRCEVFERT